MEQVMHTPGPWWSTDHGVRDSGGYICHTNEPTRYEGQDERYQREKAERAANKRLIAAAPELFAELFDILRSIEGGGNVVTFGEVDITRYRSAISKATSS